MSTVKEIQDAIAKLPEMERFELMHLLHLQYEGEDFETDEMIAEAEEGERQIAEGKFITLDEARKRVGTWTTK